MARQCRSAIGLPQLSPDGPVPYDRHLYSMKAVDALSLATLTGRVVVPCTFAAYSSGPLVAGDAELRRRAGTWIFTVRTALSDSDLQHSQQAKEPTMSDKLLTRISRLVSGVAHNALAQAEDAAAIPVMEQAVRDIDDAVKDVRSEIGQAEATKFNVGRRIDELKSEHEALEEKIATAISESRDDLAEAGAGRQLDIENQLTVLQHSLDEADGDIARLTESLNALLASRREAIQRVRDLKAAGQGPAPGAAGAPKGGTAAGKAAQAIESAEQLGERLTGVPADQSDISHKDLDDLAELHRQHEIRERLARYKARLKQTE
jgi:phage shock protein A